MESHLWGAHIQSEILNLNLPYLARARRLVGWASTWWDFSARRPVSHTKGFSHPPTPSLMPVPRFVRRASNPRYKFPGHDQLPEINLWGAHIQPKRRNLNHHNLPRARRLGARASTWWAFSARRPGPYKGFSSKLSKRALLSFPEIRRRRISVASKWLNKWLMPDVWLAGHQRGAFLQRGVRGAIRRGSCIVKSFRSRIYFLSSPLWTT